MATIALRRSAFHLLGISVAVYLGAREIYSHDFSNSTDVFRGPFESPVGLRNTTILPPIESLDDSTSITSNSDAPTFTTTEYITIVRTPEPEDRGLSTVRPIYGGQNGRNPYANNPLVQSLSHAVAPLFGNPTFKAVHGILEKIWKHPVTKVIVDAINFVLGFFLFLWALLPEGVRDVLILLAHLSFFLTSFYSGVSYYLNWKLRGWVNPSTPDDSASPPSFPWWRRWRRSHWSGVSPGGGGGNPPSDDSTPGDAPTGPKPPTNTRSVETQTGDNITPAGTQTDGNTASAEPQTDDNSRSIGTQTTETRSTITARERECQNNLQRVQSELAEARINTAANEGTIARLEQSNKDLRLNHSDLRRQVDLLTARNNELGEQVSEMTEQDRKKNVDLSFNLTRVQTLQGQILRAAEAHSSEISRLQAERGAAPTDLGSAIASHQEEIKRLNESHEAEITQLTSTHDAIVQKLESEVEKLKDTPRKAEDPEDAEERHRREIKDAIDRERAKARKELQDKTAQHQERISELQKELEEERKQRERSATLSVPTPQAESAELSRLRQENQRLNSLLASKDSAERAAKEQKKLSAEAQENQTKALADCNNKVGALENTNAELAQQNKTLLEKDREARDAEKKARSAAEQARTENESLRGQIESLSASLSAQDGNDAAIDAAQRAKDNEEELKTRINELEKQLAAAKESAQADADRIKLLEHKCATAEEERNTWKQTAEKYQSEGNTLVAEYNDMLKRAQGQEENLNNVLAKNAWLNEKGLELEDKFKSLQDAYNHLERKLHDQHQKCKEEKDKLVQQYQAVINHEKGNSKTLRDQVSGLQERNQELQDENAGLRSENGMLRSTNTSLIQTNNSLADDGLERGLQQALENQARDEQMGNTDQAPQPTPSSNQGPQPNPFTNQAPQSNPFSNRPSLFPSQTGTSSGGASLTGSKRGSGAPDALDKHPNTKPSNALGRAILTPRSRSPPKNKKTAPQSRGSSPPRRGPQGFNMIPSRPQSRGSSPPRRGPQGFNMISSRPATPNVFDSVTGSNHSINTNFTNGALGNIPVLPPNHNFSTGAPASTADDALMTSPGRSPARGFNVVSPSRGRDRGDEIMSSPSRNGEDEDTAMGSPHRTRDEERAAHNASQAASLEQARREREEREKREHEERKAQAARDHEAMLQAQRDDDLGDFEPDEPADGNMDITTNNTALADTNMGNAPNGNVTNSNPSADDNMDTEPTGTSSGDADMVNSPAGIATPRPTLGPAPGTPDGLFSPLIRDSAREIAVLRTRLGNANGAYDEIYRNRNYVDADALDDGGEPVFY